MSCVSPVEATGAETSAWAACELGADSEPDTAPAAAELAEVPGARDKTNSATSLTASFTESSVRAPAS